MLSKFVGPLCGVATITAFGAALALSSPLPAKDATPVAKASSPAVSVKAGHYTTDPGHTLVQFRLDHLGVTPYLGLFGDVTGTLDIDPAAIEKTKVDVTIPVSKITVASAGLRDHLFRAPKDEGGKPDFFGPNPADARFVSTSVEATGADTANLTGNLTLNGVTKPVSMAVRYYGAGEMPPQMGGQSMIGFEAETEIKRSEFGLSYGVPMVGDAVQLDIVAAFEKKPAR